MQGAFNIKTKRQLEICKQLPLKLHFEAKFKEAPVACPTACKYKWRFWQRLTKALLSRWVQPTVSDPRALAQPKAPNWQAALGIGISAGPASASARGSQTSTANSQQCQQSHSERKVQLSSCLLNVQTEVQISSKQTQRQSQDGESSPTAPLSHQVLDH